MSELRALVGTADIYKISLGRNATLREEALKHGALVFASEKTLFEAVMAGDETAIARAGRNVRDAKYPRAGVPEHAYMVWRRNIETFCSLPDDTLVVHWDAKKDRLFWGISGDAYERAREEPNDYGQTMYILHRGLVGGWRSTSLAGDALTDIHPRARDYAVNRATINRVIGEAGYFRALIRDEDTTSWEQQADWREKAKAAGWRPKDKTALRAARRKKTITPEIEEAAAHVLDEIEEIKRMAATAVHTAAYANGQTVLTTVKNKDIGFTREEIEEEIARLLKDQGHCCALTGYDFRQGNTNPHLKMSLDRKDSDKGYVEGNLQVVTRAANFYKSASDEKDWALKAMALERMAIAIQKRRKASAPTV